MRWNSVDAGILMCYCLEEVKKNFSASSFNLYYRL